eukprot:GHVP01016363.1.p4 GENE.GHVP01016363.1~~GHVP01016363.1.p4  ORF type:complete len:385 (-),score=90.50 GHVP01016363.1:5950-7104(-)
MKKIKKSESTHSPFFKKFQHDFLIKNFMFYRQEAKESAKEEKSDGSIYSEAFGDQDSSWQLRVLPYGLRGSRRCIGVFVSSVTSTAIFKDVEFSVCVLDKQKKPIRDTKVSHKIEKVKQDEHWGFPKFLQVSSEEDLRNFLDERCDSALMLRATISLSKLGEIEKKPIIGSLNNTVPNLQKADSQKTVLNSRFTEEEILDLEKPESENEVSALKNNSYIVDKGIRNVRFQVDAAQTVEVSSAEQTFIQHEPRTKQGFQITNTKIPSEIDIFDLPIGYKSNEKFIFKVGNTRIAVSKKKLALQSMRFKSSNVNEPIEVTPPTEETLEAVQDAIYFVETGRLRPNCLEILDSKESVSRLLRLRAFAQFLEAPSIQYILFPPKHYQN